MGVPGGVVAVTIGGVGVVIAGAGAVGQSLGGRVRVVGGRVSDGGVLGFGGVLHLGGVLSEVRCDAGVAGRGGGAAGLSRLPASGLTYGLGAAAGVLRTSGCALAY